MKRRDFLTTSCLAGLAPLAATAAAADAKTAKQYLELKLYKMASAEKRKAFVDFLAKAAIPAWERLGIKPVGVFEFLDDSSPDLYVLLPAASADILLSANDRLMADAEFLKAGAAVLGAPKSDPAYQRVESTLMLAFDGVPTVRTPAKGDERVFRLRIYESHNAERAKKKIEMFNTAGELDVFVKNGLNPVFFGESLVGSKLPNLTYMLGFDTKEAGEAAWAKFLASPGWTKLKKDPAYKDTVSGITNIFLRPAACSQI